MILSCSSGNSRGLSPSLERTVLDLTDYGPEYAAFRLNADSGSVSNEGLGSIGGSTESASGRIGAYFRAFDKTDNIPVFFLSSGLYEYETVDSAAAALPVTHAEYLGLPGSDWLGSSVSDVEDVSVLGLGSGAFMVNLTLHDPDDQSHVFHQVRAAFQEGALIGEVVENRFDAPDEAISEVATWAKHLRGRITSSPPETNVPTGNGPAEARISAG